MFVANTKDDYSIWFDQGDTEQPIPAANLRFQKGPIGEFGVNGITNEVLLEVLINRTQKLNALFPCIENRNAIAAMNEALGWFNSRTAARQAQGVEGTNAPHTAGEPS